jgi:hypothetical protein
MACHLLYSLIYIRINKGKFPLLQDRGHDCLTFAEHIGQLSKPKAQGELGHRKNSRAVYRPGQGLGKPGVGNDLRGTDIQ